VGDEGDLAGYSDAGGGESGGLRVGADVGGGPVGAGLHVEGFAGGGEGGLRGVVEGEVDEEVDVGGHGGAGRDGYAGGRIGVREERTVDLGLLVNGRFV
jgi:hypothetical protein